MIQNNKLVLQNRYKELRIIIKVLKAKAKGTY